MIFRLSVMLLREVRLVLLFLSLLLSVVSPAAAEPLHLTPDEQAWLRNHPVVRAGIGIDYPPFEFYENNGYHGMAYDYMQLVSRRLGIRIEPVPVISWQETLEQLRNRSGVDLVILVTRDEERERFIEFTGDYISFPAVLFTRKDSRFISGIRDLYGMTLASERNFIGTAWLRRYIPEVKIIETGNTAEALESVATGKADAYLGNLAVVSYLIEKKGFVDLKVAAPSPYPDDAYAMGVRKDWPELARIIDKALADVSEEEHRQIRQKWLSVRYEHGLRPLDIALWVTAVAGILAVFILQLRRMVRQRTTDLQKSLLQLEDTRQKLADIIEFLPDATFVLDREGCVIAWNRAIEQMSGIPKTEMIGKGGHACTVPFFGEARPALADVILGNQELKDYHYEAFRKQGHTLAAVIRTPALYGGHGAYLSVTASPLTDHAGNLVGAIESLRDITSLRRTEERIRVLNEQLEARVEQRTAEMEQAKEELKRVNDDLVRRGLALEEANLKLEAFAYSVSHDLRAPLRRIRGFAGLLLEEHAGQLDRNGQGILHRITVSCQRMDEMILAMLELAQSSRQELRKVTVDPGRLAEELASEMPQEGARIDILEMVPCEADPVLLKQVYANLIDNALKYSRMKEDARIEIGSENRDGQTVYFVRDNGIGFDMTHAESLFGVFTRLHSSADFEGVGIGLAIVHDIVHRHGGRIWAEGVPGEGAAFFFTLGESPRH